MNDESTVNIGEENFCCWDEIYEAFFRCPSCEVVCIIKDYNYCPSCGEKLEWNNIRKIIK